MNSSSPLNAWLISTPTKAIVAITLLLAWGCATSEVTNSPVTIWSDGIRLAGNMWHPADAEPTEPRPAILLVHGWGGVKSHLNQAYAPQFAALGYSVLTFDYRGWGDSDGMLVPVADLPTDDAVEYSIKVKEIRTVVNPLEQLEDIRAAVAYLRGEPGIDSTRLAIWGSSLGGGLALATAIAFPEFKVLISQVGAVNPRGGDDGNTVSEMTKLRTAISRGDAPSFPSTPLEGLRGFPDWPAMFRYDPMQGVEGLRAASLIIEATNEELMDINLNGVYLYDKIKDQTTARYETIEGKHYDVYQGEGYRKALGWQTAWLQEHLPAR